VLLVVLLLLVCGKVKGYACRPVQTCTRDVPHMQCQPARPSDLSLLHSLWLNRSAKIHAIALGFLGHMQCLAI